MAVLVVAACSGGHHSSSAPPATTSTLGPTSTVTPSSATPTTAGVAGCATERLTLSLGPANGAAGTVYYNLMFRNSSSSPCTLAGYPGVSFLDSSGRQVGEPAQRSPTGGAPSTVTVAPGQTAYAALGVVDPGVANCTPATASAIRAYPPGQTTAAEVRTAGAITICGSGRPPASIGPVTAQPLG